MKTPTESRKRISSEESLALLALGDEVPEALWTAVARVLAWAYRLDEKATVDES